MTKPADKAPTEFLFAYGTLQPGRAPAEIAPLIAKLEIVGRGFVRGTLYDFGHYPGAVLNPASATRIPGTVYKLHADPELVALLDEYEEYFPGLPEISQFIREQHPVHWDDGRTVLCWVYVFNEEYDSRRVEYRGHHDPT
jgi:gamma-glutamylcyclotransferase (GGCT)/AIG2-like uncharacterized protein YtfP